MATPERHPLATAILAGEPVAHTDLAALTAGEHEHVRATLRSTHAGRHWLRADPALDAGSADRLLAYEEDFRQPRRDRTLAAVIERASSAAIERHLSAIAASPAAPALFRRLAAQPTRLIGQASGLVAGDDVQAAEATLHLLVLDPLDPFEIGERQRLTIAANALVSGFAEVRGLAAEYLAAHDPVVLQRSLEWLLADESERVRGIVWIAALRVDRPATVERASALLSDETTPVPMRRSALVALGSLLPTAQMADVLSYFVVHPDHELASDAANLLFRQHRNPTTATAARDSPHADVREIAEQLLDPLRGSPAAGGSRPGDPTRSSTDIFADMIRQLEERADNHNDTSGR
ncbi:MAG: hypothetical protein M3439_11860 [Chloroflexota bacterium]|nr:hypothetical protein [Chloroflexota bacterium]